MQQPPHTPIRIALAGCGEVAEHKHLPALRRVKGARVTAVADPDLLRARRVAAKYGIPAAYTSLAEVIAAKAADVVGVLTPPDAHMAVAAEAVRAGLPVLIEKPLALTRRDADTAVEFARTSGLAVMTGLHMRWHRLIVQARDFVRSGGVGEVESIHTVWNSPRGDDRIPRWKTARQSGGGALIELGVHLFDMWRFVLDTEVQDVFARVRHGVRHDEAASVNATLEGGVLASASISERSAHSIELRICGSLGRLHVNAQKFEGFEFLARQETPGAVGPRVRALQRFLRELPGGIRAMKRFGDYGDSYRGQWQHFVDAVATGVSPSCTAEDGRASLLVCLAAAQSAATGQPVRVADAPESIAAPDQIATHA